MVGLWLWASLGFQVLFCIASLSRFVAEYLLEFLHAGEVMCDGLGAPEWVSGMLCRMGVFEIF